MLRLFLVLIGLLGAGVYALTRPRLLRQTPSAQLVTSYAEALQRIAQWQADEVAVLPECRTHLLTHGQRAEQAVVFLHGFTNCPYQFHQFEQLFFARGANVLNVRLTRHGMADPLTSELAMLSAEELVATTATALDIAHGLGEQVVVIGFSLGGILAGWAAEQRADVQQAILIAPAIGVRAVPAERAWLTANAALLLPNSFRWWDPVRQQQREGPPHAYPRFATHGVAQLVRIGALVFAQAQKAAPLVRSVTVITNPCDDVVDNATVAATVAGWRRHGATVHTHEFPAEWQLIHDLMDPTQPRQQVDRVYPQLMQWIAENPA